MQLCLGSVYESSIYLVTRKESPQIVAFVFLPQHFWKVVRT